jgi:MbtH protein
VMPNDDDLFVVVLNDEGQHSLWEATREAPPGWHAVGSGRSRAECLHYIEENWRDMRPKSLKRLLDG